MEYHSAYHSGLQGSCGRQKARRDLHLVVYNKLGLVDRLLSYLEKEDSLVEQIIGYGLCAVTFLYLLFAAVRIALVY